MELWCPFAVKLPFTGPTGGSMSSAYPPRGVLHTTESRNFYPQTHAYYGHQNPPHFTVYKGKPYQHYPMNVAARALQNQSGGEQTNRAMAYQIEWVWNAKDINDIPDSYTKGLAQLMRWIEEQTGIKPFCPEFGDSRQYGYKNPGEFTDAQWRVWNGWCGHQHVPENAHWDPGPLDARRLELLGLTVRHPAAAFMSAPSATEKKPPREPLRPPTAGDNWIAAFIKTLARLFGGKD